LAKRLESHGADIETPGNVRMAEHHVLTEEGAHQAVPSPFTI
jgi:hypothetical protein